MADDEGSRVGEAKAIGGHQEVSPSGDATLNDVNNHCAMPVEVKGDEAGAAAPSRDCDGPQVMDNHHTDHTPNSVPPLADDPPASKTFSPDNAPCSPQLPHHLRATSLRICH